METIEDAVESICDEHVISGEKVWTMVYALADTKLNQFPEIEEEDDEMCGFDRFGEAGYRAP